MTGQPVHVVLPMLTLVPEGMGGSETYAKELVAELARRPEIRVSVLVPPSAVGIFGGVSEVVVDRVTGGPGSVSRVRSLVQALVPGTSARTVLQQAQVVHYPFTVPVPLPGRAKRVVTVHDMLHQDLPQMFGRAERLYRSVAYDLAAKRADRIITVSEFSRERIVARLGISSDRIDVAPLGVDATRFIPNRGSREHFVFYPAASWPHKNHRRLIDAMEILRERRPGVRLVLTGAGRERLGILPGWVEHRGLVSIDEVHQLYRRAGCLAFPSLYEGFGLPPLEAMATGCPVASSAVGPVREICGDAATYFDPQSAPGMADAIEDALMSNDDRRLLGVRRAAAFTWTACADAHVRTYLSLGAAR